MECYKKNFKDTIKSILKVFLYMALAVVSFWAIFNILKVIFIIALAGFGVFLLYKGFNFLKDKIKEIKFIKNLGLGSRVRTKAHKATNKKMQVEKVYVDSKDEEIKVVDVEYKVL